MTNTSHTELRWFVDRDTGSWVLQFKSGDVDWKPIPVEYKQDVSHD
jgi:hypothetical protein